ncbi:FAD-linked oxidoreductase [Escherichia coli]|nr:FAD-linked oxidoreductase [Escherichia coli]
MSRHMNRIIEINPEEGWVRVEAGVIKDQLNQYLKPFGYFFPPELCTTNRATLGVIRLLVPLPHTRDLSTKM